jgi:hypothetical protein
VRISYDGYKEADPMHSPASFDSRQYLVLVNSGLCPFLQVIERISYDGHDEDGLISRSMSYLFDCLDSFRTSGQKGFLMKASYLEIYNEQVGVLNGRNAVAC